MKKLLLVALLASSTAFAEDKQEDSYGLWDFLNDIASVSSSSTDRFIATHGEQYRIENGRVYNGTARKYLESKDYYRQDAR